MQLKDIEYVDMLAKEKKYSSAAAKLFITQPTLSQAIQKLEAELQLTLFNRTTKSVELTPAGEIFLKEGREILRQTETLYQRMEDIASLKSGILKIGISTFYSSYYLAKIISTFRKLHPGIRLEFVEDISINLEEMALSGQIDVSLIPLPLIHTELETTILRSEQILLAIPAENRLTKHCIPNPAGGYPSIDLWEARDETFISLRRNQRFAAHELEICQRAGFTPKIAYEISNWDTINTLIACGIGVGFVSELVCRKAIDGAHRPVYCQLINENTNRLYAAVYRKEQLQNSLIRDFLYTLHTIFSSSVDTHPLL